MSQDKIKELIEKYLVAWYFAGDDLFNDYYKIKTINLVDFIDEFFIIKGKENKTTKQKSEKCYVCDNKPVLKLVDGQCEKCRHNFDNPPKSYWKKRKSCEACSAVNCRKDCTCICHETDEWKEEF